MNIITAYATKNDCYKKAQKMTPAGIVVHSTGANNPYLKRYVDAPDEVGVNQYGNTWNNSAADMGRSVCVHSFIGYDKNKEVRVANILPYNYCCWGVGGGSKGSYNYNPAYIQFEMCEDGLTDEKYFAAVRDVAIEYCAYLCKKFNLSVDNIVSHKEAHALGYGSNHGDPDNWWSKHKYTMDMFRAAVKAKLAAENTATTAPADSDKTLYRVQTGAFSKKANATALAEKLKKAGFDTYIVQSGNLYKVQVGAYSVKENADAMAKKLKAAGFDTYITTESGTAVAADTETKKTVDEIAREVIAGKWGNGSARKQKLTAAGYDYSAVQKRVNELLK